LEKTKAELTKVQGELRNLQNEKIVLSKQSNLNPQHLKKLTDIETEHRSMKQLIDSIQTQRLTGFDDSATDLTQHVTEKVKEASLGALRTKLDEYMASMTAAVVKNISDHKAAMRAYAQRRKQSINDETVK
jgi:hypothetical protein